MATNQAYRPEVELSSKVKAALEELISKKNGDDSQGEATIDGVLVNDIAGDLCFAEKHDWHGHVTSPPYPEVVQPTDKHNPEYQRFGFAGPFPDGSKGGFVYRDAANSSHQWVVAFDSVNVKAYIETGVAGAVDWKVVEEKLNASDYRSESRGSYCTHYPAPMPTFVTVFRPFDV